MPHMLRNLILMILLFHSTFLSSLEAQKCVKFYLSMVILKTSQAAETAVFWNTGDFFHVVPQWPAGPLRSNH